MPIPDGWTMAWESSPAPGDRITDVDGVRAGTVTGTDWWTGGSRVLWDGDADPTVVWAQHLVELRPTPEVR